MANRYGFTSGEKKVIPDDQRPTEIVARYYWAYQPEDIDETVAVIICPIEQWNATREALATFTVELPVGFYPIEGNVYGFGGNRHQALDLLEADKRFLQNQEILGNDDDDGYENGNFNGGDISF